MPEWLLAKYKFIVLSQIYSMKNIPACPKCNSEFTYENGDIMVCPECFYEWNPAESVAEQTQDNLVVVDSNGKALQTGDSIIIIKDLPVKGAPKPLKAGTKVKNIRLVEGDHNISCRIDGFGAMALKSEFVKKA
jgi:protein PhnA